MRYNLNISFVGGEVILLTTDQLGKDLFIQSLKHNSVFTWQDDFHQYVIRSANVSYVRVEELPFEVVT